jgi:hypothetical protein
MEPFLIPALASGVGALASFFANQSAADRAAAIQNENFRQWLAINIPDPNQQRLALEQYVDQGDLSPAFQQAIAQDPSSFEKIVKDQQYKRAQNAALEQLQQIGQGGLRLEDKAALNEAMLAEQARKRGEMQAISANAAQRGIANSGIDIASQIAAQSASQDRAANNSLNVAAQAQNRALDAIMKSGSLATDLAGQDFDQQARIAQAQDAINAFNTQNLRNVNAANVDIANNAQQYNLSKDQNLANANVDLRNKQQEYNKQLAQQYYNNQIAKQAGMSGYYNQMAGLEQQKGQNLGNLFKSFGGGISDSYSAYSRDQELNKYMQEEKKQRELDRQAYGNPSPSNSNSNSSYPNFGSNASYSPPKYRLLSQYFDEKGKAID